MLKKSSKSAIVGVETIALTDREKTLFQNQKPFGFILFTRNCKSQSQVKSLVSQLHDCVGWECPILIDQEGGRVSRLKSPEWEEFPSPDTFRNYYNLDPYLGQKKVFENACQMAEQLNDLNINVNCTPVVDMAFDDTHDVIGDRALGDTPFATAFLARRIIDGHHKYNTIPIIKHIPGHGRAKADSHKELPHVNATFRDLKNTDFQAFRLLIENLKQSNTPMPWAMTAHIVYDAIDADHCATQSPTIINDTIRGFIGFDGFLVSDCLTMEALSGNYAERTTKTLNAGCDAVLHCSGDFHQMEAVLNAATPLSPESLDRYLKSLPNSPHFEVKKHAIQ